MLTEVAFVVGIYVGICGLAWVLMKWDNARYCPDCNAELPNHYPYCHRGDNVYQIRRNAS